MNISKLEQSLVYTLNTLLFLVILFLLNMIFHIICLYCIFLTIPPNLASVFVVVVASYITSLLTTILLFVVLSKRFKKIQQNPGLRINIVLGSLYAVYSWLLRYKSKILLVVFLIFATYFTVSSYIISPGNIDFYRYSKQYQFIAENITYTHPEIYVAFKDGLEFHYPNNKSGNTKMSCINKSFTQYSPPSTPICDVKYDELFTNLEKTRISSVFNTDGKVEIRVNSLSFVSLEASYIYSKGLFKKGESLPEDYTTIINDDWAVRD